MKKRLRLEDDTDSDNDDKGKKGKTGGRVKPENEKMRVPRAMEVFGEAAKQRTSILKRQVQESTRQAEKTARINAAEADGKFKNKIREGSRADLRVLKKEFDYESESSEAQEVKETIAFFKEKASCIFEELQKKSIQSQPTTIITNPLLLSRHSSTLSSSSTHSVLDVGSDNGLEDEGLEDDGLDSEDITEDISSKVKLH